MRTRLASLFVGATLCLPSPAWSADAAAAPPAARPLEREEVPAALRLPERGRKGRDRYGDPLPKGATARLGSERFRVLDPGMNVQLRFKGQRLELVSRVNHLVTIRDVGRAGAVTTLPGNPTAEHFALSRDNKRQASGCGTSQRVDRHWLKVPNDAAPRPASGMGVVGKSRLRTCAAFDSAAKTLVTVREQAPRTHLWRAATGEHLRAFPEARCDQAYVAMAPDGGQFACTTSVGVEVWRADGERVALHEGIRASAVGYAEDGRTLAVGFGDRVDIYDAKTQQHLAGFPLPGGLDAIAVTADRGLVAGVMRGKVRAWQVSSGRPVPVPEGHTDWVTGVVFSADGRRVITTGRDGDVLEWDPASGAHLRTLMRADVRLESLSASAEGNVLAALTDKNEAPYRLFLLDAGAGTLTKEIEGRDRLGALRGHGVVVAADGRSVVVSGGGKLLVRALSPEGRDRDISLRHDVTAERLAATTTLSHAAVAPRATTAHPVLVDLGGGRNTPLRLPRMGKRASGGPSDGHEAGVSGLAFSPDGARLATAGRSGNVYLWSVADGGFLGCFQGRASALAFDESGKRLVLGTEGGGVSVIDARPAKASQHGKCTAAKTLRRYEGHHGPVETVAVSPDGKRIASGSRDGMVLIWRAPR